jgi:hypothetical protein
MRRLFVVLAVICGIMGSTAVDAWASSGTERFVLSQVSVNAPQYVIAVGPLTGTGRATAVTATEDLYTFKAGTVLVTYHPTSDVKTYNPKTCVYVERQRGTWSMRGHTGAYAHVAGNGTFAGKIIAHGCNPNGRPDTFALVVEAIGQVST